jgi:DNA-binding NarL/FixJ family response regulator
VRNEIFISMCNSFWVVSSALSKSDFGPGPRPAGCCLGTSTLKVLVVEDFEPFRQLTCRMLQDIPEMLVIREASDGLAAVEEVRKWQPELILLDIGLPALNGLEAAVQIRKLSPNSKILFLSQECSAEVVKEAFTLGASGYVVKSDAGTELLAAISTIVRGEKFIGSRFRANDFSAASATEGL